MRTLGINQVMSASLYGDEAQLDSFRVACVEAFCAAQQLTLVGNVRTAFSFGQLVHAPDCSWHRFLAGQDGQCIEDCAILPCDKADASVVMMRVEFDVAEGDAGQAVLNVEE